jgi:hypothetical protein
MPISLIKGNFFSTFKDRYFWIAISLKLEICFWYQDLIGLKRKLRFKIIFIMSKAAPGLIGGNLRLKAGMLLDLVL